MNIAANRGARYDSTTIALHWLAALLVVVQWSIGQTIDAIPKGPGKQDYLGVHLTIGVLLTLVLLFRLAWRAGSGRRLPPADPPALHVVAKATHWGLYALMAATAALGITTAWAEGAPIYTLARIPSFAPGNHDLGEALAGWHGTIADAVLILAGVHASAALLHQYVLRDRLIRRMAPAPLAAPDP